MSYILDALKKSEQERGHGNVPGVQTIHSASISYRDEKRSWWPYILIAAVLMNIAVIIFFNMDKFAEQKPASSTADQALVYPVERQAQTMTGMTGTTAAAGNSQASTDQQTAVKAAPLLSTTSDQPVTGNRAATVSDITGDSKAEDGNTEGWEVITPATMQYTSPAQTETIDTDDAPVTDATVTMNTAQTEIIDYNELPESIRARLPAIIISAHVYSTNPGQRSIVINNDFMEEGEYLIDDLVLHEITREGAVLNYRGTLFHYGAVSSWQ